MQNILYQIKRDVAVWKRLGCPQGKQRTWWQIVATPYSGLAQQVMMTSSNGSIFRVTGLLCGEFTGHRWIPRTKASGAELWCFLWSAPKINGRVNNREAGNFRRHRAQYDVIVMGHRGYSYRCRCVFAVPDPVYLLCICRCGYATYSLCLCKYSHYSRHCRNRFAVHSQCFCCTTRKTLQIHSDNATIRFWGDHVLWLNYHLPQMTAIK